MESGQPTASRLPMQRSQTIVKHKQAVAAKIVAEAQLANINAGTRAEVIEARKAGLERAQASVVLAQKTYDRVSQLAEHGNAPQARLDQATDSLHENQRAVDQAKSAYEQAVNGYTKEEREIAVTNVQKAVADIEAGVQSIIDQMVVYAPVASQVYKRNVNPGEYISPGVPLVTLIDLNDLWVHFDLREDLVRTLKVGDRFDVRIPALDDRRITVEVKLIATKGEYASWRATPRHWRFRSADLFHPRLSHREGPGAATRHERVIAPIGDDDDDVIEGEVTKQ
jgi:HlyD family secretion protein